MQAKGEMIVRFWGVRGSYPTTGSQVARYGGNTACVEVEANGNTLILDAGTGIIPLGKALVRRAREQGRKVSAVLLFSHLHHDHTQGFPFFVPAFIPGVNLAVFGPDFLGSSPQITLEQVMQPPYFPIRLAEMNANMSFEVVRESDALLVGPNGDDVRVIRAGALADTANLEKYITVRVLRSYAHPGGVLHYRIDWQGRSLVYATDTEGYVNGDRRLASFAHGADVMIHDAQYTDEHYLGMIPGLSVTQGFGHSTVSIACQAAINSEAQRLVLFHHAPEYDDATLDQITVQAAQIFPQAIVAREGLEIRLGAGQQLEPLEMPCSSRDAR